MLFAQKRFFRIVSLELLKRLLRLMEPIRELEMLLTVILERHLQIFAISIQLQAFEKLWTNLDEWTTKGTLEKWATDMWSLDIPRTTCVVSLLLFATSVIFSGEAKSHIKNLLYSQASAHKNQERLTPHAFDFFIKVHSAEHPVKQAGSWILI